MADAATTLIEANLLQESKFAAEMGQLSTNDAIAQHTDQIPPHRSHDPATNQKKADPFTFGSRYLQDTDNVFEFNAWDHVETDDTYKEYAEVQYAKQRESPVSEFDKSKHCIPHFSH